MLFTVFLAGLSLFRLVVGQYFPLIGDEAYYWLWSQRLDLSYVDHPPLIAYYIKLFTLVFGKTELAFRLGALTLVTLTTILVYQAALELYNKKIAWLASIMFSFTPMFLGGSIFLVPQQPFLFFWLLSLWLFIKLYKTGDNRYWYWLGISTGFGLLSDYIMTLFFICVGIFLAYDQQMRRWWTRKEPYLGLAIALAIFSPVIIWNLQHGFTPAYYLSQRAAGSPNFLNNFLSFLGLEIGLFTPILFFALIALARRLYLQDSDKVKFLSCFSSPVFLTFLVLSPFLLVGGHWLAAAYVPAILLLCQTSGRQRSWLISLFFLFALLTNIVVFGYYLSFYPTSAELAGRETTINRQLGQFLKTSAPAQGKTYYYANNLGVAGLVAFHGRVDTYLAEGRLKQFDIWGQPKLKPGDNVIYFALNETEMADKLKPLFQTVRLEPQKRLFTKDADIPNKTEIYHCWEYKGGQLP